MRIKLFEKKKIKYKNTFLNSQGCHQFFEQIHWSWLSTD